MSRVKICVFSERKPRWFSLRAISTCSSAPKRRRICSSALGGNDQVGLAGAAGGCGGNVHAGKPMAVGGHHPHALGPELPEHAVQDGAALLGAGGEGHVPDQFLEIARGGAPGAVELDGGEGGELLAREAQELEAGAAALDGDPLLA
jgi:hypothetical protein